MGCCPSEGLKSLGRDGALAGNTQAKGWSEALGGPAGSGRYRRCRRLLRAAQWPECADAVGVLGTDGDLAPGPYGPLPSSTLSVDGTKAQSPAAG